MSNRFAIPKPARAIQKPSPYDRVILENKVRFIGDRVAVVAAETLRIAEEALQLIEVEFEVLPAVLDLEEAMQPGAPVIHDEQDASGIYAASHNLAAYKVVGYGDMSKDSKSGSDCRKYLSYPASETLRAGNPRQRRLFG
jgi:CO/xanthine dehydrogenase Mo-binding subunit